MRAAGFRALLAAVFFFATAFLAAGFADLAAALGFDFVFAAILEVARFADFLANFFAFAADFPDFFAADFAGFFFRAGFAIPKLLLVAFCSRYRVVRASTFLYSAVLFHYNPCGEPQNSGSYCDSPLQPAVSVVFEPDNADAKPLERRRRQMADVETRLLPIGH